MSAPVTNDLVLAGCTILDLIPDGVTTAVAGGGAFLTVSVPRPGSRAQIPVGRIPGLVRWSAVRRRGEPFWMLPCAGHRISELPHEVQALHIELPGGRYAVAIPLLDGAVRCCLRGAADERLEVMLETGDAGTHAARVVALYVAVGDDPHRLAAEAARTVAAHLGVPLRQDKALPPWVDGFGWCTWDAFYQEVDAPKVMSGLASLAAAGARPRTVILDDGWQQVAPSPGGERRLAGLGTDGKFPGGLAPLVAQARSIYGVTTFMVWHAMQGYWGGARSDLGYRVVEQVRKLSPYLYQDMPSIDEWWGEAVGVIHPDDIARFFDDYHRALAAAGIAGVKVDNQAAMESLGQGLGGRVAMTRAYRQGLEASVTRHFSGNLINCMSCGNDTLYQAAGSNLTRTSTDFWPKRPESHGLHLWTNALVSHWFGHFIHPDWDMFQSHHPLASFHAAARAISGAPVYVSDKPGCHDAALLHRLVLADGSVLRCAQPARMARDCLHRDLAREEIALTLVNRTVHAGVIGAFNVQYHADPAQRRRIAASLTPIDLPDLPGDRFAVRLQRSGRITVLGRHDRLSTSLDEGEWELAHVATADAGFAALGLADYLNGTAAITSSACEGSTWRIGLRCAGEFTAWSATPIKTIRCAGRDLSFRWDAASGALSCNVPGTTATEIELIVG